MNPFKDIFKYCDRRFTRRIYSIRSLPGPDFPAFGLNTEIYSLNLRIQSKCGKMRTRKTPNTNTVYVVFLMKAFQLQGIGPKLYK